MAGNGYATVEGFLIPTDGKPSVAEFRVPAKSFVGTLAVNVDNARLTDKEFREFVRNTLSIVEGVKT